MALLEVLPTTSDEAMLKTNTANQDRRRPMGKGVLLRKALSLVQV